MIKNECSFYYNGKHYIVPPLTYDDYCILSDICKKEIERIPKLNELVDWILSIRGMVEAYYLQLQKQFPDIEKKFIQDMVISGDIVYDS